MLIWQPLVGFMLMSHFVLNFSKSDFNMNEDMMMFKDLLYIFGPGMDLFFNKAKIKVDFCLGFQPGAVFQKCILFSMCEGRFFHASMLMCPPQSLLPTNRSSE